MLLSYSILAFVQVLFFKQGLVDKNKFDSFYNSASKIELYIDENWIRNVASLYEKFDEKTLEEIFLCYGNICSLKSSLKSDNKDIYQIAKLSKLLTNFFDSIERGEPKLNSRYKNLLDILRREGNIKVEK